MIRAVLLACLTLAAAVCADRQPLPRVLDALRAEGLTIVSSDALVRDDTLVAVPEDGAPRDRLDAALLGTGLAAVAGPRGSWLVVADPPRKAQPAVVVSQVLVTSDKVADVSSLEAWKKSFIKPGMSDRDKALAVWTTVVSFRHQEPPPCEWLESAGNAHDPIKCFNVYGYGMCCCASANVEALARCAGLEARGRIINSHSVPEVKFDGAWHLLDGSLITWFPKDDGTIASVDEISDAIDAWNAAHGGPLPGDKLAAMMRGGGWRTGGPDILKNSKFYDENGWLPAATHGWYSTMGEYQEKAKHGFYEYGTAVGYRVNVQLRPGERLTRSWSNKGLHVNQREGGGPGCMTSPDQQRYSKAYGDLAPGRVGNGVHEWQVPLVAATLAKVALQAEGIADAKPGIAAADGGKPGVIVLRVPSSYVFLSGTATLDAAPAAGGSIAVELSDDNGGSWKPVATVAKAGPAELKLDDLVFRRYDYRLRLTLTGKGTALKALGLRHDVQHSQRALPALAKGDNTISLSTGDESTITVQGAIDTEKPGQNVGFDQFKPVLTGVDRDHLHVGGSGSGSVSLPVATPGDLKRVRVGVHYRARDAADGWDAKVSFDDGRTWVPLGRCAGPVAGNSLAFAADAPKGVRAAVVRFDGQQRNTACIFDLRIDADYVEPAHGAAPVQVTYVWEEGGKEKRDVHVATKPQEQWKIACATDPLLKDLIVELAP